MKLDDFLRERSTAWDELAALLRRARGRPERLGARGALELGALYRGAVADLALARRAYAGAPVVRRLERLVIDARQTLYNAERSRHRARDFVARGYWRGVRERPGALLAAIALTVAPALLAALWAVHDPGAAIGLVPSSFRAAAEPQVHHAMLSAGQSAGFSSQIFTNNIQVTFLAFAGGLLACVGTIAVLLYNSLQLGALVGLTGGAGTLSEFLRYVFPHGVLELSCIAVTASAGLRMGWALIDPGYVRRGEALRREAQRGVMVVLGTAPWLVVAGLVEGFVTPRNLPLGAAAAIGVGLAALYWGLVVTRGGRREPDRGARA